MGASIESYERQVFALAYRLTGNRHDAEDLTQETLLRAFAARDSFDGKNAVGWLRRITTNVFLDNARRTAKIRMFPLNDAADTVISTSPTPQRALDEAELDADIEAALAALPVEFRAAIVLSDIAQMPGADVASALGVQPATVRSRIFRARKMLRTILAHRAPSMGDLGRLSVKGRNFVAT